VRTYLPVFDGRNCGTPNPAPPSGDLLGVLLTQLFAAVGSVIPAPPCVQGTPYLGNTTQYPHVTLAPPTK